MRMASEPSKPKHAGSHGFRGPSRVANETLLLIALSVGDLLMTYTLLRSGSHFYESNPIAQWFFSRWNIAGMTAFKFGVVAIVVVLGETIERHKPGVGRAILMLGCLGAVIVIIHGFRLLLAHG
jgi:hypothetical protein